MEVSRVRALRGPNLWSRHTALEAIVACNLEECSIANLKGFEARIRALFPGLGVLSPSGSQRVVSLASVLEYAAFEFQAAAGCRITFSRTAATLETGTFQVIVEYSEEAVGRLAMELAQALIHAALNETAFDLDAAIGQLKELDEAERLGPSTGAIVDAAVARGIPYRRLTKGSMVQFGWGSKQRRIQAAEVDATSAVAESIAQDKDLTKKLLRAAGVPVPMGRPVTDTDDAWAAALEIGLPVVVKPDLGERRGMPFAATRVLVDDVDQLTHVMQAVADHLGRVAPRRCDQFVTHHQQAEVTARQKLFDDHLTVFGSGLVSGVQLLAGIDVDGDAFALVAVLRFDDHRQADLQRGRPGVVGVGHGPAHGHRHTGRTQQFFGQVFVLRNRFGHRTGGIHLGSLNAALL